MTKSLCEFYEFEFLYELKNLDEIDKNITLKQSKYKDKLRDIEDKLKEEGVDVSKVKNIAQKHAINTRHDLKTKNPKTISKAVTKNFKKAIKEVQLSLPEAIGRSIMVLIFVLAINTYASIIISILCYVIFGQVTIIPTLLVSIFVAPIVEEYSKYFSIKNNFTGSYFVIFNIVEFTSYILRMLHSGMGLIPAMIMRSLPLMMHGITTYIQYHMRKNAKDNKEDPEEASKLGLIIGIIIHFFWNLGAITFEVAIKSMK